MKLYQTFAVAPGSNRDVAVAVVTLAQLPDVTIRVSVNALRVGEKRFVSGFAYCEVDDLFLERGCSLLKWKTQDDFDCIAELHLLLGNPQFCERVLEAMAKDIAGLTRRTFRTSIDAREEALRTLRLNIDGLLRKG